MKILFSILLMLVIGQSFGQGSYNQIPGRQRFTGWLGVPVKDTITTGNLADTVLFTVRPQDGLLYYKYKTFWQLIGTGGSGSSSKVGLVRDPIQADSISADSSRIKLRQSYLDSTRAAVDTIIALTDSTLQVRLLNGTTFVVDVKGVGGVGVGWGTSGNTGLTGSNYLGTDNDTFNIKAAGYNIFFSDNPNANLSIGSSSLGSVSGGIFNTIIGHNSSFNITNGNNNTALGYNSLISTIIGNNNTAIGANSLSSNITGSGVTALGASADVADGLTNATAIGYNAKVNQSNSLILGDTSNTNVGIGRTIPLAKLHVSSTDSNIVKFDDLTTGLLSDSQVVIRNGYLKKVAPSISGSNYWTLASDIITNNNTSTVNVTNQNASTVALHVLQTSGSTQDVAAFGRSGFGDFAWLHSDGTFESNNFKQDGFTSNMVKANGSGVLVAADSTAVTGDYITPYQLSQSSGTRIVTTTTATASQTAFTFTSVPASYNDYDIYRNGVWQEHSLYTASGNIVTFGTGVSNGDKITYRRIY